MSLWRDLSAGETTFDFVGLRRRWFTISAALLLISVVALGVRQLNLGLEFVGGVSVDSPNPSGASIQDFRQAVSGAGVPDARIQLVDEGAAVRIQTGPLDEATEDAMIEAVTGLAGTDRTETSLEAVGPTFGGLVARQALIALGVFLAFAVLFISWRLQWKMAIAGIVALLHDVFITVGVYALLRFPVTPATVVALLTILGYSLYDTVVVFDRVDEFTDELTDDHTYSEIVNISMNKVLVRSLLTSLTSLLPVGSLLFVGSILLGASSLKDFALALFVGIAAGTYSSVTIAGPLLAVWREREPRWIEHRQQIERVRGLRAHKETDPAAAAPARPPKSAGTAQASPPDRPAPPPRPPKKRSR